MTRIATTENIKIAQTSNLTFQHLLHILSSSAIGSLPFLVGCKLILKCFHGNLEFKNEVIIFLISSVTRFFFFFLWGDSAFYLFFPAAPFVLIWTVNFYSFPFPSRFLYLFSSKGYGYGTSIPSVCSSI